MHQVRQKRSMVQEQCPKHPSRPAQKKRKQKRQSRKNENERGAQIPMMKPVPLLPIRQKEYCGHYLVPKNDRDGWCLRQSGHCRAAHVIKMDPSLSLPEVAHLVGVSPEHLGRLFRKDMGEGFVAFRQRARLDTLDRIIADRPDTTLLDAALEAGFGSYPQFYRAFRALRGCAPYAYYKSSDGAALTAEAADGAQL